MIDLANFKALEKATKDSFFKQKNVIKKVLAGKQVACEVCKQPLVFHPPTQSSAGTIKCAKGCIDIELDMS